MKVIARCKAEGLGDDRIVDMMTIIPVNLVRAQGHVGSLQDDTGTRWRQDCN